MARKHIVSSALVIALGAAIAVAGTDRDAGDLAARVNGEKIWAQQLDGIPSQPGAPAEQGRQAAARSLERIIDHELLAQQARRAGLDREPRVAQAVEAARRQILAQAWLEHALVAGEKDNRAEVEQFYRDNPALFRERRIYRVLEVAAVAPPAMLAEIRKAAAGAGNLNEVAAWLQSREVPFNVSTASRPAEQVPLNILPRVAAMRDGEIAVFPTPRGASIVQLLSSTAMPMSEREAAPVIERYLANRRRVEVALAAVSRLRAEAEIEYVGEYGARRADGTRKPRLPAREASLTVPRVLSGGAGLN